MSEETKAALRFAGALALGLILYQAVLFGAKFFFALIVLLGL